MSSDRAEGTKQKGTIAAGLSVFGLLLTGLVGVVGGVFWLIGGLPSGGGLYLLAAAVAFGLLANAVFRD